MASGGDELALLLSERRFLLDKKFAGTETKADRLKLAQVRWALDRICDGEAQLSEER